ncbi:MAG TPA: ROK family protein [Candidatus Limnocylindrales bacterium]
MTLPSAPIRDDLLVPGEPDLVVGVDVGGTKTAALVVDPSDVVLARDSAATDGTAIAEGIVKLVRSLVADAGLPIERIGAIGIGIPGHVDPIAGTIAQAVNMERGEQRIAGPVEDALGRPTFLEHDARAAARWLASLDPNGRASLAYVSVGTGISAGIVLDGRVVAGVGGIAGEIGHVVADPSGPVCVCGLRGCLEAVASGPAIARAGRTAASGSGRLGRDPSTADVLAAAAAGDSAAVQVVDAAAGHLARAIRGLVLAFGVEQVVLGGGVARAGDALMEPLLAAIARERAASPLVRTALPDGVVRRQTADPEAGTWGAVAVARDGLARKEVERRDVSPQAR